MMIETITILLVAITVDLIFGEPKKWHPLVGLGKLIVYVEKLVYPKHIDRAYTARLRGVISVLLLLTGILLFAYLLINTAYPAVNITMQILLLYFCIGLKSLFQHSQRVYLAVKSQDINAARKAVSMIVSRDTKSLDIIGINKACIESSLENTNDAVLGAVFWFLIAGVPGAVAYRLINTLDAMWGYKNERYLHFGWAAAKLDDLMNYIPARLCALSFALVGHIGPAIRCWYQQAGQWESSNAGAVMASGAGALDVSLGGQAVYHNRIKFRPQLGSGNEPEASDILRALYLIARSIALWLLMILVLAGLWILYLG